ncbi:hypothetical protein BH09PLA1_BH09PLA1_18940 [soil metagenome]
MDQIAVHPATTLDDRSRWWKPAAVATLGAALAICVIAQAGWLNGSPYFPWPYRDRSSLPALRFYVPMLLAAAPIIAAWFLPMRSRRSTPIAIALLMLGVFAMKLVSVYIMTAPMSFALLAEMVRSPTSTSYYTDAAALQTVSSPLEIYPEFLAHPGLHLHTLSKPPGPVMFYFAFIRAMGFGDRSAIFAAIVIAAIAACSIPAMYALVKLFTADRATALIGATLLALCPGFILHFPPFDETYAILACALIGFWHLAISRNSRWFAILFGITLALATFVAYNLLVLGALLTAWSVRWIWIGEKRSREVSRIAALSLWALGVFVACYVALGLATGFNPIATFRTALANQNALLSQHADQRPYPATIWFDLVDFALGFGWVVLLPAIFGIVFLFRRNSQLFWISVLGIALPVFVAIVALLQAETSRVWIFMLPTFLIPAAVEVKRWRVASRAIAYATMLLILLTIGHNMIFLIP